MRWVILGVALLVAGCAASNGNTEMQSLAKNSGSLYDLSRQYMTQHVSQTEIAPADRAEAIECWARANDQLVPNSKMDVVMAAIRTDPGDRTAEQRELITRYIDNGPRRKVIVGGYMEQHCFDIYRKYFRDAI